MARKSDAILARNLARRAKEKRKGRKKAQERRRPFELRELAIAYGIQSEEEKLGMYVHHYAGYCHLFTEECPHCIDPQHPIPGA